MEGQDGMYLKKIPNVEHELEFGQLFKYTHIREIFMATREMQIWRDTAVLLLFNFVYYDNGIGLYGWEEHGKT